MANNRTPLKAWVRYDYNKMMVPGSIIYRRTKPGGRISHYEELIKPDPNFCCPVITPTCTELGYWAETLNWSDQSVVANLYGVNSVTDDNCNTYKLSTNRNFPGYTFGPWSLGNFIAVEKVNGNGQVEWKRILFMTLPGSTSGSTMQCPGENIALGIDNSLYISCDWWLIKLDTNGNTIWSKAKDCYDSAETCNIYGQVIQTLHLSNGRVYTVGQEEQQAAEGGGQNYYVRVMEIDPATGNDIIGKKFYVSIPGVAGPKETYSGFIHAKDNADNLIITINGYSGSTNLYYSGLMKLDADLNQIWGVMFDKAAYEGAPYFDSEVTGLAITPDNEIYCAYYWDESVTKLSPTGTQDWSLYITFNRGDGFFEPSNVINILSDSKGDAYVISKSDTIVGASPSPVGNTLGVSKVKNDGTSVMGLENIWTDNYTNTWITNWNTSFSEIKNNILYITSYNYATTLGNAVSTQYKLPIKSIGYINEGDTHSVVRAYTGNTTFHVTNPFTYAELPVLLSKNYAHTLHNELVDWTTTKTTLPV